MHIGTTDRVPTVPTATSAANSGRWTMGRHSAPRFHWMRGFVTLIISLIGMFVALLLGAIFALAGLMAGIIGLLLMILYLVSVMVFFWELVIHEPDLKTISEPEHAEEEWITEGDWVNDDSLSATVPLRIASGKPATRPRRWTPESTGLSDPAWAGYE
jgi:hypothetical protein